MKQKRNKSKLNGKIFFALAIILIGIVAYLYINQDTIIDNEIQSSEKIQVSNNIQELRWENMPITYSFSESCVGQIVPRVEWAFDIITNATNHSVYFKKVTSNADISFICYSGQNIDKKFITEGLATTTSEGNIITEATIEFWSVSEDTRPASCQYFPSLELHEILHTFGFEHIENNHYNIMYPYVEECLKEIEKKNLVTIDGKSFYPADDFDIEQSDCMNYIYSNGEISGTCEGLMNN